MNSNLKIKILCLASLCICYLTGLYAQKTQIHFEEKFSFGAGFGVATGPRGQYMLDFNARIINNSGLGIVRIHSFHEAINYRASNSSVVPRFLPEIDYSKVFALQYIYWIPNKNDRIIKFKVGPSYNKIRISHYKTVSYTVQGFTFNRTERQYENKSRFGLNVNTEFFFPLSKIFGLSIDISANLSNDNTYLGIKLFGMRFGKINKFK